MRSLANEVVVHLQDRPPLESEVALQLRSLSTLQALGQATSVACEIWLLQGSDPDDALAQQQQASFVGMASLPLRPDALPSADQQTVQAAAGSLPVYNVLEGTHAGKLEVHLQLCLNAAQRRPRAQPAHDAQATAQADLLLLPSSRGMHNAHVTHSFCVTIQHLSGLPDAVALQEAQVTVPVARYVRCAPWHC